MSTVDPQSLSMLLESNLNRIESSKGEFENSVIYKLESNLNRIERLYPLVCLGPTNS